MWGAFATSGTAFALIALPVAPINSPLWDTVSGIHGEFEEMIGWPELVEAVANIYAGIPAQDKPATVVLAQNYGEAGAVNLLGQAYGLPRAISGMNTYWLRGHGNPPPQTAIVVGLGGGTARNLFESCETVAIVTNRYSIMNEEKGRSILLCRSPRAPWSQMWRVLLSFG